MKKILFTCLLASIALSAKAQIQIEEAKPQTTPSKASSVAVFDSTTNTSPAGREKHTYLGRELFFLNNDCGEFFDDSTAEYRIHPNPQLKYYIVLDRKFVQRKEYYDSYRQDIIEEKARFLYKLKEKGTENIVYYDPELNNPLMPYDDAFTLFDVIWVSYYNYLKTEYIGKTFAFTHNTISDYNTGKSITYRYNDIWTVDEVKVMKNNYISYRDCYVLRLVLKNRMGNVITVSPKSTLMVDKKTFDGYVKQYGPAMVKAAFEGELKVGMHKNLVYHVTKEYADRKDISVANTSKGEEWTIRNGYKTRYINFNKAGKVISWREEDTQTLRMTGKVSVTPR